MKTFVRLFLLPLTILLAVLTPVLALAQTVTAPPAPSIGQLLLGLLTPGNLGVGLGAVMALGGGLSFFTARRKKLVALASYYAFHIVEDIGNEVEGDDGFDKTAAFLKKVDEYMVANGWRPLKPGEVDAAKMNASALHGVEVAKEKIAVAAAEAVPVPAPQVLGTNALPFAKP